MTPTRSTLILTAQHVRRLLTMPAAMTVMEQAFRAHAAGRTRMPPKLYVDLPEYAGDFRAMPAYLAAPPAVGIKWVNVHPRNPRQGLPTVMGMLLLNDPRTGYPVAVLDGTLLTSWRTGAAGGVAARWLSRRNSHVVALVGCGQQAVTQLLAICAVRRITTVHVWGPARAQARDFMRRAPVRDIDYRAASSVRDCVRGADIVVTTTPSRTPLVHRRWLTAGAHINAIGADAPGKRELARDVVEQARLIVDDWTQAAHAGELNVPVHQGWLRRRDVVGSVGEVILGRVQGRRHARDLTVFDSTGLAIQDVALAHWLYRRALTARLGSRIRFF